MSKKINLHQYDAIVIGSGCAGFNSADCLYNLGKKNICLITEGVKMGTSRNTGSDKQTYYKMGTASDCTDDVRSMAETLFKGKCMNGDTAFLESSYSLRGFYKLVEKGVDFPKNEYGEYVGYQTDHDTNKRATSVGPLTSKLMTEALEKSVVEKGIKIADNTMIFKLFKKGGKITGALGINTKTYDFELFCADQIILATGGNAYLYRDTVYPYSQTGMSGMAIEVGAQTANLCEWQYGLASIDFRWNVSGTYQQVIPTYISVDEDGTEHEFLLDYFDDPVEALNQVFRKGYQWPFDSGKIEGSSVIDLIVYNEINVKGRKVYMDFRRNPTGLDFDKISKEAYDYLKNSDALFGLPIDRLNKMNKKAIDLYKSHRIDLYKDMLRVSVCAQHQNGGIAVDKNYESSIKGLYAAGEAAGVFGVYRPGGTALNSTQVSAIVASEQIAAKKGRKVDRSAELKVEAKAFIDSLNIVKGSRAKFLKDRQYFQDRMSCFGAFLRNGEEMKKLQKEVRAYLKTMTDMAVAENQLPQFLKFRDMLITMNETLSAMIFWCENVHSRGGAISHDVTKSILEQSGKQNNDFDGKIIKTKNHKAYFEDVRPIPETDLWFESVYNKKR